MISENQPHPHRYRTRFLWALLGSALVNLSAWVVLPAQLSNHRTQSRPPVLAVSVTRVRIERRIPTPRPRRTPQPPKALHAAIAKAAPPMRAPEQTTTLGPPPPAYLALPPEWSRQDFAFLGTTQTAEWLDWSKSKQNAKWVPRIFLWRMKAPETYMRRATLRDAVGAILTSLRQDAKITISKSQRVCDGATNGWFLSYVKSDDDPPLHFDETVLMAGDAVFRAMYIRAVDQPEDPHTREALNTLCRP